MPDPIVPVPPAVPDPAAPPPPVAPPPSSAAPPAAAAQPPLPGVQPPAPAAPPSKGKGKMVRMPEKVFVKRLKQEGRATAVAELGMTLEEAKEKLRRYEDVTARGAPADPALRQELADLRSKVTTLETQIAEKDGRIREIKEKSQKLRMTAMIQGEAVASGVADEHMDFALDLYRKRCASLPEGERPPQPKAYFAELRKTRAYLFTNAPPGSAPTEVPAVAPSSAPAGTPPAAPAAPAAAPGGKKVEEMTPEEFSRHTYETYGTRPGA